MFGERITERFSAKESRREETFGEGIAERPSGKESRKMVSDCSLNLT
jgi:hypothetical protein